MGASQTQWRGLRLVSFLWQGPMAPVALSPGPSSWPILALGTVADFWLCPSCGPDKSFYAFLQCSGSCQGLPMSFLALASSCSPEVSCLPLWATQLQWQEGQVLADSSSPPPPDCSPFICLRQSFKGDTMTSVISHALSGPHSGGLGDTFKCIYLMVEVPNFFTGNLVPYQLDSSYICPRA